MVCGVHPESDKNVLPQRSVARFGKGLGGRSSNGDTTELFFVHGARAVVSFSGSFEVAFRRPIVVSDVLAGFMGDVFSRVR